MGDQDSTILEDVGSNWTAARGGLGLGVRSGRQGWRASRYGSILAGIWLITPWQDQRKGENAGEHETGKALGPPGFSGRKRCRC